MLLHCSGAQAGEGRGEAELLRPRRGGQMPLHFEGLYKLPGK